MVAAVGSLADVLRDSTATLRQSSTSVAIALLAGSTAGVATYLWRSPWDTLYKKRMGWRSPHAPLLSSARFVTSPRGLKAVLISGCTWAVYEAALVGVTLLVEQGVLSP